MTNKVILIGRLGQDAQTKLTKNSQQFVILNVATWRSKKDQAGNFEKETTWHNVMVFGAKAGRSSGLKKGMLVYVEGMINNNKYVDKHGIERTNFSIVADEVKTLEKPAQETQQQSFTGDDELPF